MRTRNGYLVLVAVAFVVFAGQARAGESSEPAGRKLPNIVLIFADDK